MHEKVQQPFAEHERDFTLEAAIDVAALAVKKGPVALCSAFCLLLQENKRLKAHIELLQNDLRAAQEFISLSNNIQCYCQHAKLKKIVHLDTSPESNDKCIQAENICHKKSFKKEIFQQAVPESAMKLPEMENSFGGDSGIQLSLSQSLGELLLPQLKGSEGCSDIRRISGSFLHRNSSLFQSSLFRRNSKAGKSSSVSSRNSFRAVQLKSVRRRTSSASAVPLKSAHSKTSLDYSSDDTMPKHLQIRALASGSFTTKPKLAEACVSEDDATTISRPSTAGALCAVTVVAQVHQSANDEEMSGSQTSVVEEGSLDQTECGSAEEDNLESRCPLFGCLCQACSELQLLDPGFMYCIDECAGNTLAVGTELLVSKEGDDQQTVTVSVLYVGHARQRSLPPGYEEADHPLAFPVGVVAIFPDGQENFVPLSNVLYVIDDDDFVLQNDQSAEVLHITEDHRDQLLEEELVIVERERETTNSPDRENWRVLPNNGEDLTPEKCLKPQSHECGSIDESETRLKSTSFSGIETFNSYGEIPASESDPINMSNLLQGSYCSEMSSENDVICAEPPESSNNPIQLINNASNFSQAICFKQLSVESNLRTDVNDAVALEGGNLPTVDVSQTRENNFVMEAVNPDFVLSEQCSSYCAHRAIGSQDSRSDESVLLADGKRPSRQFHQRACDEKFNFSSSSCRGCSSSKCCSRSKCSYSKSKFSCYNSCNNSDDMEIFICGNCKGSRECKCSGRGESEGEMSRFCLSTACHQPTVGNTIQHDSNLHGCYENDCFEADDGVTARNLRLPDSNESLSCRSSSVSGSCKNSFFLKGSYGSDDRNSEDFNPTNKKLYSMSFPSSDMCFENPPNFNRTSLGRQVRCASTSLTAENTCKNESIIQRGYNYSKSFDFLTLNTNTDVNPRKQISGVDNTSSLSDRDVRISIRNTSPENVPRASTGDVFNRALKLFRRWSSSMAESIDLTDVSHV